jgi:hypothetical protein
MRRSLIEEERPESFGYPRGEAEKPRRRWLEHDLERRMRLLLEGLVSLWRIGQRASWVNVALDPYRVCLVRSRPLLYSFEFRRCARARLVGQVIDTRLTAQIRLA